MRTHIWALLPLFLGGCSFTRVNNHPTTYYSTSIENRRLERTREIPAAAVEPSVSPPRIQNAPPNVPVQEGKPVSQIEVNHRVILDWSQLKPELKLDPHQNTEFYEKIDGQLKTIKEMLEANLRFWEMSLKTNGPALGMKANTNTLIVFGVLFLGYFAATASIFVLLKKFYARMLTVQTR